ncbi:gamma-glutamyl-gamma-aminobutyrate hydrolase family protein [Agathobaculum sp.]|uniref:gamma-glutamyl-gamma-aminobutyrate hydrolase family protein n=1 Tax=Agathobaculum sp. TaxID=2048138 RepID=UPI002A81D117|nr:type 1 glutamine amidotransferase [Agathobaculum sp.]MDY3617843.1 type 1 glutamine amidotransferase [Agathobaculum sp.]
MVHSPLILISSGRIMGDLSMQRRQSELYGACLSLAGGMGALYTQGGTAELSQRFDGLLLAGGGDPHPALYGQKRGSVPLSIDPVRDAEEQALFAAFEARHKPILGICRGVQMLNVCCGGTLYQHIEEHMDGCHSVTCTADLAALIGGSPMVNSYHHQAVDRAAPGFRVAARAADNTIEALWHRTKPILGVQWHPERMVPPLCEDAHGENHLALFGWLIQHC